MKINKKLILLSAVSISLLVTGCASKTLTVDRDEILPYSEVSVEQIEIEQKNSFLTVPKLESVDEVNISSWKNKISSNNTLSSECSGDQCVASFAKPNTIKKSDIVVGDEPITPPEEPYFASTETVQVGAFRKISGAQSYAKRYSLLGNQYSVFIKQGMKDFKPIYRVQVTGFSSQEEAENFINRYGSEGAFFVRK